MDSRTNTFPAATLSNALLGKCVFIIHSYSVHMFVGSMFWLCGWFVAIWQTIWLASWLSSHIHREAFAWLHEVRVLGLWCEPSSFDWLNPLSTTASTRLGLSSSTVFSKRVSVSVWISVCHWELWIGEFTGLIMKSCLEDNRSEHEFEAKDKVCLSYTLKYCRITISQLFHCTKGKLHPL